MNEFELTDADAAIVAEICENWTEFRLRSSLQQPASQSPSTTTWSRLSRRIEPCQCQEKWPDRPLDHPLAAQEASDRTKEQWKSILDNIPRGGTDTGAHVKETLSAHAREAQAAMRSSREAGLKVMHTLTQNYATLVSGVLIGLSEALEHGKPKTKH